MTKYRAPALDKGLDILELLAQNQLAMTLSQISLQLDRSPSELFRMVQTLEQRGYVQQAAESHGYELTNKLFSLGLASSPKRNLLQVSLPLMEKYSRTTQQSCHLAVASRENVVVIARMEAPGELGFNLRLGYQRPITHTASGLILFAFQNPTIKQEWRTRLKSANKADILEQFEADGVSALNQGYFIKPSDYIAGIVDISCPIWCDNTVIAALTSPYIQIKSGISCDDALAHLKSIAEKISQSLGNL